MHGGRGGGILEVSVNVAAGRDRTVDNHISFSVNLSPVCMCPEGQEGVRETIPVTFAQTSLHFFQLHVLRSPIL